jgi:hypothetical protein
MDALTVLVLAIAILELARCLTLVVFNDRQAVAQR